MYYSIQFIRRLLPLFICVFLSVSGFAMESVIVREDGMEREHYGRIIIKAKNATVIQSRDGTIHILDAENIVRTAPDDGKEFAPFTKDEIESLLKKEFPGAFNVHRSKHYLIVHNTSDAYVTWTGNLLDSVYNSFLISWKNKGFPIKEAEFPLVAVLFSNQALFKQHAKKELGNDIPDMMKAYYALSSNRIVMYDITGTSSNTATTGKRITRDDIKKILEQPGAEVNITTIIHEATHQVGYNIGLQERFAPYPLWLSEGLAMMFETPTARDKNGWKIGIRPNRPRIFALFDYLNTNPDEPLENLIKSDTPLQKGTQTSVLHSYAMSWCMTYYLMEKKPRFFLEYMKAMAEKQSFEDDSPEQRIKDFEAVFGDDWKKLYADMKKFIEKDLAKHLR